MLISFSWTSPALLAGAKTVTRRDWSESHAAKFRAGMLVDAWDRGPRTRLGRKIATIRLSGVYKKRSNEVPWADWYAEGFEWLSVKGTLNDRRRAEVIWYDWHKRPRDLYVVRFELIEVLRARILAAEEAR